MINTVKKCFSLAMVVAVVFSVLACIPAFAADSEAVSGLISNSSYYFIDFETGDDAKNTSQFVKRVLQFITKVRAEAQKV